MLFKAKAAGGGMVVVHHCGEHGVPGVRDGERDGERYGKRGPVHRGPVLAPPSRASPSPFPSPSPSLCSALCVLLSASLLLVERHGCAGGRSSRVCECRPRRRRGYARNTLGTQCVRADVYIECLFQVIVLSQAVVEFVCERVST